MEKLHTKRAAYNVAAFVALGLSLFFAWRASIVYYELFYPVTGQLLSTLLALVVLVTITSLSFIVSTHWDNQNWLNYAFAGIIVVHDIGGIIYVAYAHRAFEWASVYTIVTGVACILSTTPFLIGVWMESLVKELEAERNELHTSFVNGYERQLTQGATRLYAQLATDARVLIHYAPDSLKNALESKGLTLQVKEEVSRLLKIKKLVASVGTKTGTSTPDIPSIAAPVAIEQPERIEKKTKILEEGAFDEDSGSVVMPLNFPMREGTQVIQETSPARSILNQERSFHLEVPAHPVNQSTEQSPRTATQLAKKIRSR